MFNWFKRKKKRLIIILYDGQVSISDPVKGVEVEVRDYQAPSDTDWQGNFGEDENGDKFEYFLFDDKGCEV